MRMNSSKAHPIMADNDNPMSRRSLFALFAAAPVIAAGLASTAQAQEASACVDLDNLSTGQKGMRRSLGFKLQSTDPNKHCSSCTFFSAPSGGCGKCQLLSGGPVAENSVCDSWAKKA
jgi:hypothetical protein